MDVLAEINDEGDDLGDDFGEDPLEATAPAYEAAAAADAAAAAGGKVAGVGGNGNEGTVGKNNASGSGKGAVVAKSNATNMIPTTTPKAPTPPPTTVILAPPKSLAQRTQKSKKVRYFIIKSFNHQNIATSIENGVWATQAHNELKLNAAYISRDEVRLIFSVNNSGHFQGYAKMVGLATTLHSRYVCGSQKNTSIDDADWWVL